ncbi:MAG: response regulator [Nitrospirae bacterium]|nr:response regulator [Nitrospirota bacterium]
MTESPPTRPLRRWAASVAAAGAYVALFAFFYPRVGDATAALVNLPILVTAFLFGWRGGLAAGVLAVPLNAWLFQSHGVKAVGVFTEAWPAIVSWIVVGVGSGWMRDLYREVRTRRSESQAHREAESLRKQNRLVLDSVGEGIVGIDLTGAITLVNPAAANLLGYEEDELCGRPLHATVHHSHVDGSPYPADQCPILNVLRKGQTRRGRNEVYWKKDGTPLPVEFICTPMREDGVVRGAVVAFMDTSERGSLEAQLRQAQKMEAVGRLAGGVAHDFNNLLTVILGHTEIILRTMRQDDPIRKDIEGVRAAGVRAASLTRQLLAFSRQQVIRPKVVDLNESLKAIAQMLKRLIGEDLDLATDLKAHRAKVRIDPGQLEQVVMNLAVNARDAMPTGGRIQVGTTNVDLDEAYTREHEGARPGPYVMLSVSDTGLGMTPEVMAHLFEPFFTTKAPGEGTGLGLATVYGIVRQAGGNVGAYSERGKGSTFKVYLPLAGDALPSEVPGVKRSAAGGNETILLVEDDEMVRDLTRQLLRTKGYTVLESADGPSAIKLVESQAGRIHLLLTDVVMPVMNGRELAVSIRKLRPEIRVLYMSGYTERGAASLEGIEPGAAFLQKPFSLDLLSQKVRETLDVH